MKQKVQIMLSLVDTDHPSGATTPTEKSKNLLTRANLDNIFQTTGHPREKSPD